MSARGFLDPVKKLRGVTSATQLCNAPLSQLPAQLATLGLKRWVPVTDSNLVGCLDWSWCPVAPLVVPAGEQSKSLACAAGLYAELAERTVERHTALVAVGGGVVGDLTGFVAATYLRGLPLIQVPTSLVAMVDSSLGGKTGVDLPEGKNLVGAFHAPRLVHLDTSLLATLPPEQWNCGMAEVLKHALLDSDGHWEELEQPGLEQPGRRESMVLRSRQVKLDIVAADPLEQGIRAFLNLGHTLGHAVESFQGYSGWNHGQAVGLGLLAAVRLSIRHAGLDPAWDARLQAQLRRWNLPTSAPPIGFDQLLPFLRRDKKNQDGRLRFVLLERPGVARLRDDLSPEQVADVWSSL